VRDSDEWFDEPDDLDRIEQVLSELSSCSDPVDAAALAAARITQTQAFAEGSKRTAVLLARWILDRNGQDGRRMLPDHDDPLAQLLLHAARGADLKLEVTSLLRSRR
jgi:prophage maintenance system killer protein